MGTDQLEYAEAELLADHAVAEPLLAGGVRCHGGFDADGRYVSPRTRHRVPAIEAWQAHHREVFGTEVLEAPLELWPPHIPNTAQARLLVERGVPQPLMATLTRIGMVEGFGANIRHLPPVDWQAHLVEDVRGTALAHLAKGLFEAHGRDEAGWEEEAGHKEMWFAARDVAFPQGGVSIDLDETLKRLGFGQAGGQGAGPVQASRLLPDDIDQTVEVVVRLMVRVMFIEVSAFHTFAWAESWLSDPELVAGGGEAARLVACIRADETPHVGYLRTALTELRDRTWIGASGKRYAGAELVGRVYDELLAQSLGPNRAATAAGTQAEVEHWCLQRADGADLLAEYAALATPAA
jgi:hypothetical protein